MTKKKPGSMSQILTKIKRLWFVWTGLFYKGPSLPEGQVIEAMATDLAAVLPSLAHLFLAQIEIEAQKVGYPKEYMPYFYWSLFDHPEYWQLAQGDADVLLDATGLVRNVVVLPNYMESYKPAPIEAEAQLKKAFVSLALWVSTKMHAIVLREYSKALKKWTPAMRKATKEVVPPEKAQVYLSMVFEYRLGQSPALYPEGLTLFSILYAAVPVFGYGLD